jgi:hypothetical protein
MAALRLHTSKGIVPEGFEGVHYTVRWYTSSRSQCYGRDLLPRYMQVLEHPSLSYGAPRRACETSFAVKSGSPCTRERLLAFHGCGVACIQRDALTSGI